MKPLSLFLLGLWGAGLMLVATPWAWGVDAPMAYYRCTRDLPLIQALGFMAQSSARPALDAMIENDTKVIFKDMREMGKAYKNHDALSIITDDGRHIIFIHKKHENAPPQALAAVIAHEALHGDRDNSVEEELVAWTREGAFWHEMLTRYPDLKQIQNGKVPLVDRENAIQILISQNRLKQEIQGNLAYQGLPARSPGF